MHHSFDTSIAEKYGVNVAIFLNNMSFWVQVNTANKKNFHEGRFWTRNTQEAFSSIFPYWKRQTFRTIINTCLENDLIIVGNFNKRKGDKTNWYTFSDKGLLLFKTLTELVDKNTQSLGCNQPNPRLKLTKPLVETNQTLPDIKQDIKQDKRKERGEKRQSSQTHVSDSFEPTEKHDLMCWQLHLDIEKEKDAFIDYYQAHGKKMYNWNSCFNNWLRKASEFKRKEKKEHPVTASIREIKEELSKSKDFQDFLN